MNRFLVAALIVVMLGLTGSRQALGAWRGGEAGVGRKLSVLRVGVQKLADRGGAAMGMAAIVVATCVNLLSCELTGILTDNVAPTASEEVAAGFPIMQGATTANETQLFVLTEDNGDYLFSLLDAQGRVLPPAATEARGYLSSTHVMQRVLFQGLTADTHYLLQVHASASNTLLDERELQTLSAVRQDLCFAFASCMWDFYPQGDIWEQMVAHDPDVIFLIGDNVYADLPSIATSPSDLWRRYLETRQELDIFRSRKLIPIIATWDDHDYGLNNADRNYRLKHEVREIFEIFFVSEQSENFHPSGFGVAGLFEIYGYSFFLMDNRTFRSPLGVSPERHFGEGQMQWLLHSLQGRKHAFIASGDQFFGGYSHIEGDTSLLADESFQGDHPARFAYFLDQLQALDTEVVFLSGDRHYAEIMAIPAATLGYRTYEFTSSPAHTITFGSPEVPNPLRVALHDSSTNFMLIKVQDRGEALSLQASAHGSAGQVLFKGTYGVE